MFSGDSDRPGIPAGSHSAGFFEEFGAVGVAGGLADG